MSVKSAYDRLEGRLGGQLLQNEKMAPFVTFRIGGRAALFIECCSVGDLKLALNVLGEEGVPWVCIGKGSNLLVSDKGYPGAVISLGGQFSRIDVCKEEGRITAGAAVPLNSCVLAAYKAELSGLEFAAGIPGTVGGALFGNVGSRDEWIGERVEGLVAYRVDDGLVHLRGEELPWAYRKSGLSSDTVILEALFKLEAGERSKIRIRLEGNRTHRRRTQPIDQHCAGSIFKNPKGGSAGKLIEDAGCKGLAVGDAQISKRHANFIVNRGHATAQDVVDLIVLARKRVKEAYAIELVPEIRFLGFEE